MTSTERIDLRVANAVREQLLLRRRRIATSWPSGTGRTIDRMQELLAIHGKVETATAKRLPNAAQRLKARWDDVLQGLTCAIRNLACTEAGPAADVRSLPDLLEDLARLGREFGGFEWFCDKPMLAVTTPNITLQGLDLGRFRIDLNLCSLGLRTCKNVFAIHALDLKCAASDGIIRHPHVLGEHLNAREFTEPICEAKLAGRIADLFQLIVQALQTYDPTTAYVKIEDWHKVF